MKVEAIKTLAPVDSEALFEVSYAIFPKPANVQHLPHTPVLVADLVLDISIALLTVLVLYVVSASDSQKVPLSIIHIHQVAEALTVSTRPQVVKSLPPAVPATSSNQSAFFFF